MSSILVVRSPVQVVRVDARCAPDSSAAGLAGRAGRATSAISASTPPSPSLSARMTKSRYFTETTSVIDQKISDSTPKMLSGDGRHAVRQRHALLERVERRGADVAVDDAERTNGQRAHIRAMLRARLARLLRLAGRADGAARLGFVHSLLARLPGRSAHYAR